MSKGNKVSYHFRPDAALQQRYQVSQELNHQYDTDKILSGEYGRAYARLVKKQLKRKKK